MKDIERRELYESKVPYEYYPMSTWGHIMLYILYLIPVIGSIFLIIFAFNDSNIARRNHARSYFCGYLIFLIVIGIILALILTLVGSGFIYMIQSVYIVAK